MNTDEILDQIDHALEDWEVGPDAMRWSPEAPAPSQAPSTMWPVLRDRALAMVLSATHVVVRPGHGLGAAPDIVAVDETEAFSWGPIVAQWQAAWHDELLRASYAAAADFAEAARRLTRTLNADTTWVDVDDALAEELHDTPPSRETDRFTLNDWAVSGPASDTQRALIREASE